MVSSVKVILSENQFMVENFFSILPCFSTKYHLETGLRCLKLLECSNERIKVDQG